MDPGSANLVTNIAAKAQADLQPVYLWAWAMPAICLHVQFKGHSLSLFIQMASPDTSRFPAYMSNASGPAKAWADQATHMPMAMPLALQPRHQLIHRLCT